MSGIAHVPERVALVCKGIAGMAPQAENMRIELPNPMFDGMLVAALMKSTQLIN
ncbi:hypothetical protein EV174_005746, partial [Coemansia sp. RSA 2320]